MTSYGHRLRVARAGERVLDAGPDGWHSRVCRPRCGAAVEYVAYYYRKDRPTADHPRLHRRFVCPRHAFRFAARYHLRLPVPLAVDAPLLPFGGLHGNQ